MRRIEKKTAAQERLERLLNGYEASVRRQFAIFLNSVQSDAIVNAVADFLDRGDLAGAMAILDSHIARLAAVLPAVFAKAGADYIEELITEFRRYQPTVALSFDPSFPRAAQISEQNRLRFIREFTDSQREAVRMALQRGFQEGWGAERLAREFRDVIGLTRRQERAVQRYRELLERNSSEALDRVLRDRRFDRTVERAISGGEPLTREQIDRMVSRYRERYRAHRAATIARTEAGRAASLAQEEALEQALKITNTPRSRVRRIWRSVQDARVRDTHVKLNGQEQPEGSAFVSPSGARLRFPRDPRAPAAETINCRCVAETKIAPPE